LYEKWVLASAHRKTVERSYLQRSSILSESRPDETGPRELVWFHIQTSILNHRWLELRLLGSE
jgi:hypothetical protein